jgi:glucose/arabinose dehydrogenase
MNSAGAKALLLMIVFAGAVLLGDSIVQDALSAQQSVSPDSTAVLRGRSAFGDVSTDRPGVRRLITPADLLAPYHTESVRNFPRVVPRPQGAWPQAPAGFAVQLYASGLEQPRKMITAPNGDIFLAESAAGRIRVFRGLKADGSHAQTEVFATGLNRPFGIAFYPSGPNPQYVYVGNTNSVVRFRYQNGDLKASAAPEVIIPNIPTGGHWTRDIVFSRDGSKMLLAVGSASNVSDDAAENHRANVLEYTPDGQNERVYASGIRNPVGLAIHPQTGDLWTSVNERDGLGDDLVPDYITRVTPGGFYGWPWYYIGANQDPRHVGKRPDLKDKVVVPDVLLQAHTASLAMTFYTGTQFPAQYRGHAYAAQHGSWNRARRTGYKVIYAPVSNGRATGEYVDFLIGFVTPDGNVWGRPVGVTVAGDGSLLVSDDGSNSIWRVSYIGGSQGRGTAN